MGWKREVKEIPVEQRGIAVNTGIEPVMLAMCAVWFKILALEMVLAVELTRS